MSAMHIMNKYDFEQELQKNGFSKTSYQCTKNHSIWIHNNSGKHYTIPNIVGEGIPDSVLEHYLRAAGCLYSKQKDESVGSNYYEVEKKPNLELIN